jgi:hypothetical protein
MQGLDFLITSPRALALSGKCYLRPMLGPSKFFA